MTDTKDPTIRRKTAVTVLAAVKVPLTECTNDRYPPRCLLFCFYLLQHFFQVLHVVVPEPAHTSPAQLCTLHTYHHHKPLVANYQQTTGCNLTGTTRRAE